MKSSPEIQVVGTCVETGQLVVSRVYEVHLAYGVPLEQIFAQLIQKNYLISKEHLYEEMIAAGVAVEDIEARIANAMQDSASYLTESTEFKDVPNFSDEDQTQT